MEIVLNGLLTGLLLSILVGATFFMLIETSMTRGFKTAVWFDAGVVLCDALLISGAYFFTSWISKTIVSHQYFNEAGGLVFMAFGVNYILSRRKEVQGNVPRSQHLKVFFNGFFINMLNPSVIIFWLGTMALTITNYRYTGYEVFLYYLSALVTMCAIDLLKAWFASRISSFIYARAFKWITICSGVIMIGLGIYFFLR